MAFRLLAQINHQAGEKAGIDSGKAVAKNLKVVRAASKTTATYWQRAAFRLRKGEWESMAALPGFAVLTTDRSIHVLRAPDGTILWKLCRFDGRTYATGPERLWIVELP